jgi:hypothetical protein
MGQISFVPQFIGINDRGAQSGEVLRHSAFAGADPTG